MTVKGSTLAAVLVGLSMGVGALAQAGGFSSGGNPPPGYGNQGLGLAPVAATAAPSTVVHLGAAPGLAHLRIEVMARAMVLPRRRLWSPG